MVYSTVDIYDVSTGQWTSSGTGAGSLSVARYLLAAAGVDNKIVFGGGRYTTIPGDGLIP